MLGSLCKINQTMLKCNKPYPKIGIIKLEIVDQWSTIIPLPDSKCKQFIYFHIVGDTTGRLPQAYAMSHGADTAENSNDMCDLDLLAWNWYITHHPFMGCICTTYKYNPWNKQWATEGTWHTGWTDRQTDRQTDGEKPIYPPTTLLCENFVL